MTIASVLARKGRDVVSVNDDVLVATALAVLADKRIGALPVMRGGAVVGIFSERDLLYGLNAEGAAFLDRPVAEAMTAPVVTVEPATPVLQALSTMTRRRLRHLPVIAEGRIAGFVSIGDLVKYRMDLVEADAAALREYIAGA
jgi:CBS domain-containing protein